MTPAEEEARQAQALALQRIRLKGELRLRCHETLKRLDEQEAKMDSSYLAMKEAVAAHRAEVHKNLKALEDDDREPS